MRAERRVPDCITLAARAGANAAPGPPVEIYLGTEPAQFRPTRTFLWSIERVRDPARVYRIHVLSEMAGFERRGWTTGFTNYRYAIPHYAGGRGRAIYCDVDQVFLADPALLFDLDLAGAGYLAISDTDNSVMLIDCARMAGIWSLDDARHASKKSILRRTLRVPGVRGALDPSWNARDSEYRPGVSRLMHYSTLHTQPWRPFPERFVYRPHRDGQLWLDLEREAIAAGFEAFDAANPTAFFRALATRAAPEAAPPATPRAVQQVAVELLESRAARSLLQVVAGRRPERQLDTSRWQCAEESEIGLLSLLAASTATAPGTGQGLRDAVILTSGLEQIAAEDLPWVVEALFRRARRLVLAAVPVVPARRPSRRHPPVGGVGDLEWWVAHFEAAGRRHPELSWQLALARDGDLAGERFVFRSGGRFPSEDPPRVWVLADDRPGNTTQSIGLAEELGWPYRRLDLAFRPTIYLPNPLLGGAAHVLQRRARKRLQPPWPDLVLAAGRRTAPVARWIGQQSRGRTRIVHLGRKGANPADPFDLAVVPAHARLSPHPRRMETAAAVTRIRPESLEAAATQWQYLFAPHPGPRIALLVGGRSAHYAFGPAEATRLGRRVAEMASRSGGSVFVTTSRRTGAEAEVALRRALPDSAYFYSWQASDKPSENPYLGLLAQADAIVVTGDSESMLAEASAAGKSVHVYPLPHRRPDPFTRFGLAVIGWVVRLAEREPLNNRGTTRPQQGLELFCSRLVASGFVRPDRDLDAIHHAMVARGLARIFDGTLGDCAGKGHSEIEDVANRVRAEMGLAGR